MTDLGTPPAPALERPDPAAQWLRLRTAPLEPGAWDEMREEDGALRPVWSRFARHLGLDGPDPAAELSRRHAQLTEQIQRDGITHNVFSAEGVAPRPWPLELLPLLIEPAQWRVIEQGVAQRAALLQAMLQDLYGAQTLLHEGLLPPALLMRHAGYVRAMHGVRPAGGLHLRIIAFDIARGPDGMWWVLSNRTQSPSGLGYVLHNRLLVSRQLPQAFAALHVQHIASTYRRLVDGLDDAAREVAGGELPRTVLLTPGPYSETWFEHVYLARYLGLPLVEGSDLTVRGERLFLKTVEGLEPVHGVLRRVDDDWCDPLELRADSSLGVPGLLQAVRAGTVVVANTPGSAFLESPAVQGFLPAIAQRLLGQPLAMPSLPTWWCGEQAAWDDARQAGRDALLRTTFPAGGRTSALAEAETAAVEEDPDAWTFQGRLAFSRAPIWGAGAVQPRPALVRVYAIAGPDGQWQVLPGGMTRVAGSGSTSVSMQRGGTSLDTWVLTDGEVDTFSMLPSPSRPEDIARRHRPVGSRTAENLFWLGRYTERAEQAVRLARRLLPGRGGAASDPPALGRTLAALAQRMGVVPWGTAGPDVTPAALSRAAREALADAGGACSVMFDLQAMERLATALRDRLSPEQWGLIREMREGFGTALAAPAAGATAAQAALERLATQLSAVTGAQSDRMTRDVGWRLLTVGRLIERLLGMAATLEEFLAGGAVGGAAERSPVAFGARTEATDALLEMFDSAITFRARHQRHDDLLALADVLVLDDTNPRALAGVLRRLRTELSKLPGGALDDAWACELPAEGAGVTLAGLGQIPAARTEAELAALARRLGAAAMALADRLGHRYFTVAQPTQETGA